MNIKRLLIHLLGGLTIEESQDSDTNSFMMGQWAALHEAKTFAESLNGIAADDWCKTVYNHFADRIAEVEQQSAAFSSEAYRACATFSVNMSRGVTEAHPATIAAPVPEASAEGSPRGEKPRNWPLPPMEVSPKVPAKRWMPKFEETFYYLKLEHGDFITVEQRLDVGAYLDFAIYDNDNCFKTKALAQAALDDIRDVLKFAPKE